MMQFLYKKIFHNLVTGKIITKLKTCVLHENNQIAQQCLTKRKKKHRQTYLS